MHQNHVWEALCVVLTLAGIAPSTTHAAPAAETVTVLSRDCIAAEARKFDFSGVVVIARAGAMATYARGVVAEPGSAPITMATRFNLGSAGKMFTAVAVAQLIDAGKLGLDDAIGRYVHGLSPQASTATVRQLLDHSSGLGNYFDPSNLPTLMKARKLEDLLPLVAAEKPAFPPGSRFAYSDTGFLLLGLLVERVSGQGYAEYLRAHVFQPAGMNATGLDPLRPSPAAAGLTAMAAQPPGPRAPTSMQAPANLRPAVESALYGGSSGGTFSTAGDMQRFFAALERGQLTSASSLKMLLSPQIIASPAHGEQPERDYGFGFGVGRFDGHLWFGHNGGAPGVNTESTVFPDDQSTIIVLANRDPPVATSLFRELRRQLFDPPEQGCRAGS